MSPRLLWISAIAMATAVAQQAGDRLYVGNAAGVGEVNRLAPGSVAQYSLNFSAPPPPVIGDDVTLTLQQPGQPDRTLDRLDGNALSGRFFIPADVPTGPSTVRFESTLATVSASIDIVVTAPALYGVDFTRVLAAHRGPNFEAVQLTRPAHPGETITVWGTGLGQASQAEVSATIGAQPLRVDYAGPAPGQRGLDQYNLTIPADAVLDGSCYSKLTLSVQGLTAPVGYLATGTGSTGACRHPLNLTEAQMRLLDQGDGIAIARFSLSSYGAPVYDGQALDYTKLQRREAMSANISNQNASAVALSSAYSVSPTEAGGQCTASSFGQTVGLIGNGQNPSPPPPSLGSTVRLQGPSASFELLPPPDPNRWFDSFGYTLELPVADPVRYFDQLPASVFTPGLWSFSGNGDGSLEPFRVDIEIPGPVRFRNPETLRTIDRTRDLTLQWATDSMRAADLLILTVAPVGDPQNQAGIQCTVRALDGAFIVPSTLLQRLPNAPAALSTSYIRPLTVSPLKRRDADPVPAILDWSSFAIIPVTLTP